MLSKEYTRLKKSLTKQIGLFDEVIRTTDGNTATVKQGLHKLWGIYTELCSTSTRLCELVSEDKARQIRETVEMEGKSVERVDKATTEWLTAQEEMQLADHPDRKGVQNEPLSKEKELESDNIALTVQLMRKHSDLEKQINLLDELLKTNDLELVKEKTARLEQLHKQFLSIGNSLGKDLHMGESVKVSGIVEASQARVKEVISAAMDLFLTVEEERHSVKSQGSGRSKYSEPVRSTVKKGKGKEGSVRSEIILRSQESSSRFHRSLKVGSGHKTATARNQETELRDKLSEIHNVCRREMSEMENLLWQGNIERVRGRMGKLENLQKERDIYAVSLYEILQDKDATQLSEEIARLDNRVHELKIQGMRARDRQQDLRSRKSALRKH